MTYSRPGQIPPWEMKSKKKGKNVIVDLPQNISAHDEYGAVPSFAGTIKWLRENKQIHVEITYNNLFPKNKKLKRWNYTIVQMTKKRPCPADESTIGGFKTYEEVEVAALTHALNILSEFYGKF